MAGQWPLEKLHSVTISTSYIYAVTIGIVLTWTLATKNSCKGFPWVKVGGAKAETWPLNPESQLKGMVAFYIRTDGNETQSAPEGSPKAIQGISGGLSRQAKRDKGNRSERVQKKLEHKEDWHDYNRLLTQKREKATEDSATIGQNHSHVVQNNLCWVSKYKWAWMGAWLSFWPCYINRNKLQHNEWLLH